MLLKYRGKQIPPFIHNASSAVMILTNQGKSAASGQIPVNIPATEGNANIDKFTCQQ